MSENNYTGEEPAILFSELSLHEQLAIQLYRDNPRYRELANAYLSSKSESTLAALKDFARSGGCHE